MKKIATNNLNGPNFIRNNEPYYPFSVKKLLGNSAPSSISFCGNADILRKRTIAVFCSTKCPGTIILKTYDLMKQLRASDKVVISGFHSPMERECLNILLKGKQSIIVCPARSIDNMRIKPDFKKALSDGRLLFLSPFSEKETRVTSGRALKRNLFVAAIADSVLIPYADLNSKTEKFCREIISWKKPVYTFDVRTNENLLEFGAKPISKDVVALMDFANL